MTRHLRTLLVATLTAAAVGTPAAAFAAAGPATATMEPLSAPGVPLTGPFTVKADVTMNTAQSVVVTARVMYGTQSYSKGTALAPQTVTPQDCPTTCTLTWTFDPTSQEAAWPDATVSAFATLDQDGTAQTSTLWVDTMYRSPVAPFTGPSTPQVTPTAVTASYGPDVLDTTGEWDLASPTPRTAGEALRATLRPLRSTQTVGSFTGTWGAPDPATGATPGMIPLDVTAVPAGRYEMYAQGETAAGQYGGQTYLGLVYVRHTTALTGWTNAPILAGSPAILAVNLQGPYPAGSGYPTTLEVRNGTAAPMTFPATFTNGAMSVNLPATSLPAGTSSVTARVLDQNGAPIGNSAVVPLPVVEFHETVSTGPLVVGVQSPVTVSGTAPGGLTFLDCEFRFYDAAGLNSYTSGVSCMGQKSFVSTPYAIPQAAGPARFEVQPSLMENYLLTGPVETFPVTVYANRSATYTAPTSSAYNAPLTAVVTATELVDTSQPARPAAGVAVALQRLQAGTSRWVTIATGSTDGAGKAAVRFANSTTGRLRAIVDSAVPGHTLLLPERAITAVSTVTWSNLPSSARAYAPVAAKAVAAPYERGARVAVQVRRWGSTAWATVSTAYVGGTGYAAPAFKVTSRGTWQVRVVRYGTTRVATGYSSIRNLIIR